MGAEDRDWYRDWWRKKTGYIERAVFRVALGRPRAFRRSEPGLERFVVPAILGLLLCLALFAAAKLVARFAA